MIIPCQLDKPVTLTNGGDNLRHMSKEKFLIIRFSSFGDVTQCLSVPSAIQKKYPQSEIHWITRKDMLPLLSGHPHIQKTWSIDKKSGLKSLIQTALQLRKQNYTHIYDAHNNLRSLIISFILRLFKSPSYIRRSMRRWKRFLLFRFRINKFQMPFSGQRDLLEPLQKWNISADLPSVPQIFVSASSQKAAQELSASLKNNYIALAPSAAFFLKRWPADYWIGLIQQFPNENFVLLGGSEDRFIQDIKNKFDHRVVNLAGKSDLSTSLALIKESKLLVSNDTGLLHVAEQLGKKCVALMGPAPFGFPSRPSTKIMELNLSCRPCSKHGQGPCTNKNYHECLVGIKPEMVANEIRHIIS